MKTLRACFSGAALGGFLVFLVGCSTVSAVTEGPRYPSYNTTPIPPDSSGMTSTAAEIADRLQVGFNIGNTLEAMGGETSWGNPPITAEFVAFVKQVGFTAVRLPVSWDQYAEPFTARISAPWLARVKAVVQSCVDQGLFVVVNIHWDEGWLENHVTPDHEEAVQGKQKAYWEQIATLLRDFDEHVLFASANEPNVDNATKMAVLMAHHQTFVDAVRSTGGRNAYRTLVVQGPNTDIELTNKLMERLPTDTSTNRLMVEVHDYSPWNFTGMVKDEAWGNQFYYWGTGNHSPTDTAHNPTWGEEAYIDSTFLLMKRKFVDQGIPVIIGEFGAQRRVTLSGEDLRRHRASRVSYYHYLSSRARAHSLMPFVWDTGNLLDRRTMTVLEPEILNALLP